MLFAEEQGLAILDEWPHLRLQDRVALVLLDQLSHVLEVALQELLGSLLDSRPFAALLALVDGDALLGPPRAERARHIALIGRSDQRHLLATWRKHWQLLPLLAAG